MMVLRTVRLDLIPKRTTPPPPVAAVLSATVTFKRDRRPLAKIPPAVVSEVLPLMVLFVMLESNKRWRPPALLPGAPAVDVLLLIVHRSRITLKPEIPPPKPAELPVTVTSVRIAGSLVAASIPPPLLKNELLLWLTSLRVMMRLVPRAEMPPPSPPKAPPKAEFPVTIESMSVSRGSTKGIGRGRSARPPPHKSDTLSRMIQLVTVRLPTYWIPPPPRASPWVTVIPEMAAVGKHPSKIRSRPLESTIVTAAPAPFIVRSSVISRSPVAANSSPAPGMVSM